MGNLRDQMEALAEGILTSTHERESAVADIKAGTGRMLSAFSGERRASATRLRSDLSADCRARAADVRKMRQGFGKDRYLLAKKQRNELAADCRTRSGAVAKLMDEFKISRGEMARELTESLRRFAQRVRSQVSSLREGFREDVQAAHQIWNDLLVAQTGVVTPTAMGFEAEEAGEKPTVAERVRRFVAKRGKPGKPKKR